MAAELVGDRLGLAPGSWPCSGPCSVALTVVLAMVLHPVRVLLGACAAVTLVGRGPRSRRRPDGLLLVGVRVRPRGVAVSLVALGLVPVLGRVVVAPAGRALRWAGRRRPSAGSSVSGVPGSSGSGGSDRRRPIRDRGGRRLCSGLDGEFRLPSPSGDGRARPIARGASQHCRVQAGVHRLGAAARSAGQRCRTWSTAAEHGSAHHSGVRPCWCAIPVTQHQGADRGHNGEHVRKGACSLRSCAWRSPRGTLLVDPRLHGPATRRGNSLGGSAGVSCSAAASNSRK